MRWEEWCAIVREGRRSEAVAPTTEAIKSARRENGITQAEAARLAGVSLETWRNWETGRDTMHPMHWRQWSREACGMAVETSRPLRLKHTISLTPAAIKAIKRLGVKRLEEMVLAAASPEDQQ